MKTRDYFTQHGEQARKVFETLLNKYADEGIENIEDIKILTVNPLDKIGTPMEIVSLFGGKVQDMAAVPNLEQVIYTAA